MRGINSPPSKIPFMGKERNSTAWLDWLNKVYEKLRGPLWDDNTAELFNSAGGGVAPTLAAFGPTGITHQYEFNQGDSVEIAFHIKHDIKPGSYIYPHVHWSTDGVGSGDVEWVLSYDVAKGHNQEAFSAGSSISVVQTASGTAWQHMITEASDAQAFIAPEIDSLIFMTVTRGSTSDTYPDTGTGGVFGLYVDLHYQKDRFGTPNKAPDFYAR